MVNTVEASYIMAIILMSLMLLMQVAYGRCREETSVMRLHHGIERLRGQEDESEEEIITSIGTGTISKDEKQAQGQLSGQMQSKEIVVKVHAPEGMMRAMTIFQAEEERD